MNTAINSFSNRNGEWLVALAEGAPSREAGAQIAVTLKSGASKIVTLGDFVGTFYGRHHYRVVKDVTPRATVAVGDLSAIMELFDNAKQHLRFPAIVLSVPAINETMRINVAGVRAKVPGSLNVTSDKRRDDQDRRWWYGRVMQDGTYQPARGADATTIGARLAEFAADPIKVASEHGRLTGRCCFCNTSLKDERSTSVGYGPICAGHYGLAWGERPTAFGLGSACSAEPPPFDDIEKVERDMQRMEAEADRAQTIRDERNKFEARSRLCEQLGDIIDIDRTRV